MPVPDERALQVDYHRESDPVHLWWQTEAPYFADMEAALLADVRCAAGERLLEIGCGNGANLFHLRHLPGQRVGVDFSFARAAASRASGAAVACADATRLPFVDGAFDVVLIRDLLHHVPQRLEVLREAHRVLRAGGRLHLIEPNARAPLVLLQALAIRAERGLLRSTARRLCDELDATGFRQVALAPAQPFPLARVVLHPRYGHADLGSSRLVTTALDLVDAVSARVVPRAVWLYLCLSAVRP